MTRRNNLGTFTNAVVNGYQVTQVRRASDNTVQETYGYDAGGRVTSINRTSLNATLTYNTADQLTGVGSTTYTFDAAGRRTRSSGTVTRRFLVAGTPGTDLESVQLVADGANALQQAYVYVGDEPLLRHDGTNAASRTYYLEDGMGSVIGLAPQTSPGTANTSRFFYDGLGNVRSTAGPAPTIPAGAAGDFRFHGLWLESGTGLYHVRARDYDPVTGRFLSRDPMAGELTEAESLHPNAFANSNPHCNVDPTGEFAVVDLTSGMSMSQSMQAIRTAAINEVRKQAINLMKDAIVGGFKNAFLEMFPEFEKLGSLGKGRAFESVLQKLLCDRVGEFPGGLSLFAGIRENGTPVDNGVNCDDRSDPSKLWPPRRGVRRPDIVIGSPPAGGPGGFTHSGGGWNYPKTLTVVEIKLRPATIVRDYIQNKKGRRGQFDAMVNYSAKHTYTHTVVMITSTPNARVYAQLQTQLGAAAFKKGVFCILVTNTDRYRRRR